MKGRCGRTRFFAPCDLLVYGLIVIVTAAIVFSLVLRTRAEIFRVSVYGEQVLSAANGRITVEKSFENCVSVEKKGDVYLIRLILPNGYNLIEYDPRGKIRMRDADCSTGRDCVFMPPLCRTGAIVCVPHGLKITASGGEDMKPTVG